MFRSVGTIAGRAAALTLVCVLALATAAEAAQRVALIIGNSAYAVGPLPNPKNDAEAVDRQLRALGFVTRLLRDATKAQTEAALSEFAGMAVGAEIAAVYFAGHGTERDGRNFLIPVDARLNRGSDLDLQAIPLETVLNQLSGATKLKLVILDACRNNIFPMAGNRRSTPRGLARIEPEDNTLIAYAAKDGTTADDGSGLHSPFTASLLRHMATPGLEVTFMLREVRDDVIAATNRVQTPHIYGTLGRERIFLGGPGQAMSAASPPAAVPAPPKSDPEMERLRAENERLRREAAAAAPVIETPQSPPSPPSMVPPSPSKIPPGPAPNAPNIPLNAPNMAANAPATVTRATPSAPALGPRPTLPAAASLLTDKDKKRYLALASSREEALERTEQNVRNNAKSRAALVATRALLAAPAIPIVEAQLLGEWQCRSHSIGGSMGNDNADFAAEVGAVFRCRIDRERNVLTLRKLTGSMKKLASLVPVSATEMLYYGTTIAQSDPQTPTYPNSLRFGADEVGNLVQLGADRLRIELSLPDHHASAGHEVIELTKAKR